MPKLRWTAAAACLLLALVAPTAAARDCKAPPGTAAIDQYCETIPTASGDRGSGTGATQARAPIPAGTRKELAETEDGRALAAIIGADMRDRNSPGRGSEPAAGAGGADSPELVPGANPFTAVLAAIESGSPTGSGFFVALLLATILMAGLGWHRLRRRAGS